MGFHELYVNGQPVDDRVLAPSISDLSKHVRYVTYDLSKCFRDGQNTIALWCAPGWAGFSEFHVKDKPLVLAQIEVLQADGRGCRLSATPLGRRFPARLRRWATGRYRASAASRTTPGSKSPAGASRDWNVALGFRGRLHAAGAAVGRNGRAESPRRNPQAHRHRGGRDRACAASTWGETTRAGFMSELKGKPGNKATLQFFRAAQSGRELRAEIRVCLQRPRRRAVLPALQPRHRPLDHHKRAAKPAGKGRHLRIRAQHQRLSFRERTAYTVQAVPTNC